MTERQRPLAIVNARIFTGAGTRPWAEAVALADGVVRAVGAAGDVLAAVEGAEVVDLAGRTVVPGFVDAHNHFLATGESLRSVDVRFPRVRSVADLVRVIGEAAAAAEPGAAVHASGYDGAKYDRIPTCWDLDAAAPDRAVYVGHVSGHAVLVNSAAMALVAAALAAPDPPGGRVDRDGSGRPTGVFHDAAMSMVQPTVVDVGHHGPNFHVASDPAALLDAVETAGRAYLAAGLTTVCDAQVSARELTTYREALRCGRLLVRTVCMPLSHQLEAYEEIGLAGPLGDDRLSIGAMKFYCDGSLIGGTAAFSDGPGGLRGPGGSEGSDGWDDPGVSDDLGPDVRGGAHAIVYWEEGELERALVRAHCNGWQVGVHAQGDRAIGVVLDGFDAALRARPAADPRFRIEHAGCPTTDQLARMGALGVVMITQPSYLRDSGDNFLERFGARAHRFQPVREALDAGVDVVVSSDSDVASYRPLDTIATALERRTLDGAVIGADQVLTAHEAVLAHTATAAFSLRAEHRLGSLVPGKLADLAVVGGDLFAASPGEIRELPVEMTILGGRVVHSTI